MNFRHELFAVGAITIALTSVAFPAQAEDSPPSDFGEVMSASAPALLDDTDPSMAPNVSATAGEVAVSPAPDLLPAAQSPEAVLVEPPSFTVDYAVSVAATSDDGVVALNTEDPNSEAYIQPVEGGYRVISATLNADGPSTFDYTLDVPSDAQLHEDGSLLFIEAGAQTFAVLEIPWAKDGNGVDVPTWYSLSQGVLTQHLDLSRVDSYPVLADPAWTYSYKFPTNKTSTRVEQLLRSCFNCYFPVAGAPRAFPTQGQLLPLTVGGIGNFECRMGGTAKVAGSLFQYSFLATRNHIDGEGSTITFSFRSDQYLWVSASVMNQLLNNSLYRGGAIQTWSNFANKLKNA